MIKNIKACTPFKSLLVSGSVMAIWLYCLKRIRLSFKVSSGTLILFSFISFFGLNESIGQSCALNDIGFNSVTSPNTLTICVGTTGNTINGGMPGGGPTYQWQVSTTAPGVAPWSNVAGTSTNQ